MTEQLLSAEEMKVALRETIGSDLPLQIRKKNEEVMTGFIRGFADSNCNILLISDRTDSLSMNIIEIKNINEIKYSKPDSLQGWDSTILKAK